ncbi:mucin-2 isoform X3 [Diachasmimorpha longicaudata]|uniref:mucin-2 isoform X3 n=1 Tax=Diachasmimorpha longicaudata TaxID=58733 RepID=UPI0030B8A8E2
MDWGLRVTTLALWMVIGLTAINDCNGDQRIICYYTNWSVYRPGTAKYSPQNINPYLCTHLIYAFGGFTKDNTLKPFDKYQDIEKGGYAKFTGLKTYNKNLKTMLAIGGWNEGSSRFSPMVADPERRRELVKNSVKFLRQNHFDGLDLDWEYPAFRDGGKPRDKNNYADLVQELREEFERESSKTGRPRLLLSMAIPAGIEYLEKGYDLPRLNEYLDFFNLLSYDYHSAFEPAVNHHSPLYGLEEANEYNYDSELTIDYTISYLLNHDVTSEKIVLGIPTYGRSYTLYNADATDIGAPADGPGEEGDATREKGYLAYYEICENIAKSDEWEVVQPNEKAMGPYAFRANQWVGYDDENIVRVKAFYVKEKKLGGIMFWSIDNDDFRGKCHGRPYPLIEAAKEALLSGSPKPSERSKPPAHHKKTKSQGSQRTSDTSIERKYSSPRRSGSKPTRKRLSTSRSTPRSTTPTPRIAEDREDSPESSEEHNTLSRPRKTRVKSRSGTRRRDQTRKIDKIEEDASSFSNSITTPEPPTTPDPGSDFKCEDEGFFPHPRDCKKYFWCLDSGPGGLGVVAHQFTCPSGLVFNKAADSCDYPRNVVCPKVKTAPATTTSKPSTTSKTTKKTTTVKPVSEEEEEEEYEYEDDEVNAAEDNEEVPVSTTAKPLLYKTINRSRPTTTTTTTTEATTTEDTIETARGFKGDEGEIEDTEDPKVLKELIDLIKKAGGIEQLEKQLHLQEKTSGDTTEGNLATPATISRSLYERVLNRQATKLFGGATGKDTKQVANSRGSFQNGPGRSQFEGLDEVPEVKSLRRTNKHQYVTIARQRSSTNEPAVSEEELGEEEEVEQDNDDASSDDQVVSNVHEKERNSSPKRVTPNYVNIRRARPTTESSPSEEEPETSSLSTESVEETSQDSTTAKSRYTNIHRFRSTTSSSSEAGNPSKSSEETSESPSTSSLEFTPTEPQVFSTPSPSSTTEIPMTSTESLPDATNPTISTTHQPATEPVKLVENSVTDIPLTTFPAPSNPRTTPLPRTTVSVVSSPRPFGYPRRTRPTTASSSSSSTTTSSTPSTTEQSRLKVNLEIPEKPDLPTLKQLIDTNYGITRSFDTSVRSTQTYEVNSLNDEFENKLPHIIDSDGIKVRVKILDDYGSGEVKINQFAVLTLPHGALNPNITSTVLKIEVINDQNVGHLSADDAEILDNRLSRRRVSDNNIINESSPRSSRRRGKVDQHLTTTNWTNSRRRNVRRRGNSITHTDQHAQNTEIVNISSTSPMNEHIVTTVKPTTLRGSSVVIHNSDDPVRGFFITRSLDDVPVVTDKINLAEYTTEMASTITADVMPTTIENDEVTTQFFTTESSHLWNNELDGTKLTTAAETTTTRLFDNYLTTTFQPTEMVLTPGVIEGHEGTTIRSEITTYTNDVNDGQGNNTETTTFREEQLNESNVTVEESTEAPTTTENNYEAVASTTPYSLMTDTNKINESSEKILPDVDGTTSKINDMEEGTTETPDIISTGSLADIIDRTPENRSTIILKIIPFVQDERTDSLSKLQNPTTEVIPSVTHLNPGDVQSSIASSTIPYASTHVTSPSIVSTSYSSINTVSTPPTTTSPPTPEIPLKRFRTNARTRGRVRYYPSSSSITSAPTERKPRPFLSIRRRPYTPRSRLESSESSEESLSITASSQSTTPVPPPPSPKGRIIRRGRGRGRTRQTTSTTTEQSFPSTEVPEEALKIEEDNPNNEATPKYPQAEITKEDDQIIAESSYAEVLGEVGGPRHSGSFLKRPGTIAKPTTLKSYAIEYETADRRYSSKFVVPTTENTDQTGRAQELAVSLIDPSVAASFETGKEMSRNRGGQRHKLEEFKGITEAPTTRTTPSRRRQRPTAGSQEAKGITNKPRRPAIIDYDYYVDEEVRISVKPELKNKIYVTTSGRIGCLDQGTFAHPFSCKKFITCAKMVGGQVVPTEYSCPNKLSFDPVGGICNWSAGLGCKESL